MYFRLPSPPTCSQNKVNSEIKLSAIKWDQSCVSYIYPLPNENNRNVYKLINHSDL